MQPHNQPMVSIGNFFFRYRNQLFPVIFVLGVIVVSTGYHASWLGLGLGVAMLGQLVRAAVIGLAYIKRGGMNKKVYAENLVTSGIFGVCRNPLYVGNILIILGLLLVAGSPLLLLVGSIVFGFIYQCIIYAEETYLLEKFGSAYQDYCQDVPRWIPNFSQLHSATEGMQFNLSRVIAKDYSTFFGWLGWVVAIILYQHYLDGKPLSDTANSPLFYIILAGGMLALLVRVLKKKKILKV